MRTVSGPPSWASSRTESRVKYGRMIDGVAHGCRSQGSLFTRGLSGWSWQGTRCLRRPPCRDVATCVQCAAMHRCWLVLAANGMLQSSGLVVEARCDKSQTACCAMLGGDQRKPTLQLFELRKLTGRRIAFSPCAQCIADRPV